MPTEPFFPKILPITIVASVAGFVLSSVYVLLTELFSGRAIRPTRYEPEIDDEDDFEPEVIRSPAPAKAEPVTAEAVAPVKTAKSEPARSASLLSYDASENDAMPEAPQDFAADPEFSRGAVARHLIDARTKVATSVSLSGDDGSAAIVGLVRHMAEMGRRVVLVDMTGSAVPTLLMAERRTLPGITDLLAGGAAFGEIIHADMESQAHIIPQGDADPRIAMRGVERLSMVLGALSQAYDCVIVDCGPADPRAVNRIARGGEMDVILSSVDATSAEIEQAAEAFIEAGFEDMVLMMSTSGAKTRSHGRKAA